MTVPRPSGQRLATFRDGVRYVKAGGWARFLAWLVDFVVFMLGVGVGVVVLGGVDRTANLDNGMLPLALIAILFLVPLQFGGGWVRGDVVIEATTEDEAVAVMEALLRAFAASPTSRTAGRPRRSTRPRTGRTSSRSRTWVSTPCRTSARCASTTASHPADSCPSRLRPAPGGHPRHPSVSCANRSTTGR